MENVICLIFIDYEKNMYKIIKFLNRDIAKEYYRVALRKSNFKFAGLLNECVEWCDKNNYSYEIILREKYNYRE